jgi:hypothetical protein
LDSGGSRPHRDHVGACEIFAATTSTTPAKLRLPIGL